MSFPSWFRKEKPHNGSSSRLKVLVSRVIDYVRSHPGTEDFFPQVISAALGESEAAVLAALGELDDAGVVKPKYGVYCKGCASPIEVYDSLAEIPNNSEYECTTCDRNISLDDEVGPGRRALTHQDDKPGCAVLRAYSLLA